MKVSLNGESIDIENHSTIDSLLLDRNIDSKSVVVEYNLSILKPLEWSNTTLKENDSIEVLRFVGGG